MDQLIHKKFIFEYHCEGKKWLYGNILDKIETTFGSLENKIIAEFGAGSGFAVILAVMSRQAQGIIIDKCPQALEYSYNIARYLGVENKISFSQVDIRDKLELKVKSDVSLNSGVLEHFNVSEAANILQNIRNNTKVHGGIFIIVPNLLSPLMLYRMIKSKSKGSELFYSQWLLKKVFQRCELQSLGGSINGFLPVTTDIRIQNIFKRIRMERWASALSMLFYRYAINEN